MNKVNPLVLISPLDWGLGHVTRCIPLVRELINLNCDILVACNSQQKTLFEQEFPNLTYVSIPDYNISYSSKKWLTLAKIVIQIPKILIKINLENRWLNTLLTNKKPDIIISDNRPGLYVKGIPCVYITHQLAVKTGLGSIPDAFARWLNYRFIKRFTACWVPDHAGSKSLAGQLSNPSKMPHIPVKYIGNLSRFYPCREKVSNGNLLIILSGPEPQRTLFENKLLAEVKSYHGKVTLVRGLPGNNLPLEVNNNVTAFNHVGSDD